MMCNSKLATVLNMHLLAFIQFTYSLYADLFYFFRTVFGLSDFFFLLCSDTRSEKFWHFVQKSLKLILKWPKTTPLSKIFYENRINARNKTKKNTLKTSTNNVRSAKYNNAVLTIKKRVALPNVNSDLVFQKNNI